VKGRHNSLGGRRHGIAVLEGFSGNEWVSFAFSGLDRGSTTSSQGVALVCSGPVGATTRRVGDRFITTNENPIAGSFKRTVMLLGQNPTP
jgi:hypothetical protein